MHFPYLSSGNAATIQKDQAGRVVLYSVCPPATGPLGDITLMMPIPFG